MENSTFRDSAFLMMFEAAKKNLERRDPGEIAELSGCLYLKDENVLEIETLGQKISISCADYTSEPPVEHWHYLVLLHYLASAKGIRPTGKLLSFRDMKDGLIRGTKFEAASDRELARILKGKSEEKICGCMEKLGSTQIPGNGDISFEIGFLPYFPVYLNVYLGDEEFGTQGKLFVDKCADFYLSIEDAVSLGEVVMNRIRGEL